MNRPFERHAQIASLKALDFEVLVVGGGATGLGIAVDAASRGYRTALVEAHDFAKATSSRSTKLVHGGVRYLAEMQFALVSEALEERAILCENAPHLAHDLPFIVPKYHWWEGPFYGAGLKLYDALAGKRNLGRSRMLSRDETIRAIPGVREDGLLGGIEYHDAQFDDARMALALARTAADRGASIANRVRCTSLVKVDGQVVGAEVRDEESGETFRIRASIVVNATGVFADGLRRMDDPAAKTSLEPSRGTHVVLPRRFLPADHAIMVPHTDDGRVLFVIPWHGRTLVGTTDTEVKDPELEPRATAEDIGFILRNAGRYLAAEPSTADILSVFAGLRPLARPTDETSSKKVSREHSIEVSKSGLVTVTGGKWTTYRRMAEEAVDTVAETAGLEVRGCATETLRLHGYDPAAGLEAGLPDTRRMYGTDRAELEKIERADRFHAAPMHAALAITQSEVIFAARAEMARSVEDVLARRTRSLLLDARAASEIADETARLMGRELGWTEAQCAASAAEFRELARGYLPA
ncbi:MAG: glycerol-3-phosphate dehydrogenase/oxidase [Planctomycetaceae bacterium]|nr:glycerol-3-phosphate dehydrogenase/oxidase [Planctomycetaceae bacterium]